MDFTSTQAEERYAALVQVAAQAVIGLDFDGTLAPIVEDPSSAHIHPGAHDVLVDLADGVSAIAVITGRPARQVLDLGGLEPVGDAIGDLGKELYVYGQYGNERWTSAHRRVISPRPPHGLASFERELVRTLRQVGTPDAHVEDKGLAVAVHTRRLADPAGSFERLLPAMQELASRHGLVVEPGRSVIEVRASGADKGAAVDHLVEAVGARGFLFAGDDLGDLAAFEAVARLRERGLATLLVASASTEQVALLDLADVVVEGPDGVLHLLADLARRVRELRV